MEALLKGYVINYEYTLPRDRQRARAIYYLNILATALIVVFSLYLLFAWQQVEYLGVYWILIVLIGGLAFGAFQLASIGRIMWAAHLYTGTLVVLSTLLVLINSVNSPAVLVMAVPVLLAGVFYNRQGVTILTVVSAVAVLGAALVERAALDRQIDIYRSVIPVIGGLGALGGLQGIFAGEMGRLFQQTQQIEDSFGAVLRVSGRLIRPGEMPDLMREFGLLLQDVFDLQQVQIFLRDEHNPSLLRLRSAVGLAAMRALTRGRSLYIAEDSPVAAALRDKRTIIVRSGSLAHLLTDLLPGSRAQLTVPLLYGDQVFGVVDLQSSNDQAFNEEVAGVIEALGRQFAALLYTDQLLTRITAVEAEQQQLVAHIEKVTAETQHLRRQSMGVIWDRFFRERGTDIIGYDLMASDNEPAASDELTESMDTTIKAGAVDVRRTTEGYVLTVPIILRGQPLGAMEFHIKRQGGLPSRAVDLANTVAERLSLALENARLVEQTQALAFRERQVGEISNRLQTAANMEDLLALAAEEFNTALSSARTHIRLQLYGEKPGPAKAAGNGGGAS